MARWEEATVMSLPFFGCALALLATWAGRRAVAVGLWGLSLVALLVLFRLHVTDALPLDF